MNKSKSHLPDFLPSLLAHNLQYRRKAECANVLQLRIHRHVALKQNNFILIQPMHLKQYTGVYYKYYYPDRGIVDHAAVVAQQSFADGPAGQRGEKHPLNE